MNGLMGLDYQRPRAMTAGRVIAGTSLGQAVGPETIRTHITPTITAAAEAAGRPTPRIKAFVQVACTDDPSGYIAESAAPTNSASAGEATTRAPAPPWRSSSPDEVSATPARRRRDPARQLRANAIAASACSAVVGK